MKHSIDGLAVYSFGDSQNQPMVFIHGFPYDSTMWKSQIEEFEKDYYCVSYDIRGLGKSDIGDGQYTIESMVDDLESIIASLRLVKPIVCGFSMGGYIALRAIQKTKENISALILCDTKAQADTNEAKLQRSVVIKRINSEGLSSFVKEFMTKCYHETYIKNNKADLSHRIETSSKFSPLGVKGSLLAMMGRGDMQESLSDISVPVLVMCGDYDTLTPPDVMREMASKIADASFVLIEDSAHMSPIENVSGFNDAIKTFLLKQEI